MHSFKSLARQSLVLFSVASLLLASFSFSSAKAVAASPTINLGPKISFTFDDGYATALTQAAPTLAKYGLSGTSYVVTGCVGMTSVPNTCWADTDKTYLTWDQISQLHSQYNWEIAAHTVDHYCLASSGDDCQDNVLTPEQVDYELAQSQADLAAHGYDAIDMATPYGDYNNQVLAQIAKYYETQRGFADVGNNNPLYSDYFLNIMQVQGRVSVAQVEQAIDSAIANNRWLILVLHTIKAKASKRNDDYEWSTANLSQVASYVKTKQGASLIQPVNIDEGVIKSDTNLLSNSSFNDGLAGWSTDSPTTITADAANNGSYPDPLNAVKLVSATTEAHLFSQRVGVNPATTYGLKSFLNVYAITSGSVGFYIDEYDSNGEWIAGQYKAAEGSAFVESMNFTYTPSSPLVAAASLQVIVSANAGITAYLDNVQWFPISVGIPPSNLISNGNFDSGITGGWHTDGPANIVADGGSNGSPANPVYSVKLTASGITTHLFSPLTSVDASRTYLLDSYLDLRQINSGVVAYYMDEYDASGNWISGQYITDRSSPVTGSISFQYHPSSTSVKQASLQLIVVGGSGALAYFDNVLWYQL